VLGVTSVKTIVVAGLLLGGAAPSTAQQPAAVPPPSSSVSALVVELERNNPELQAARRVIDMRVARIAPAGALPDPTVSASSMTGLGLPPFAASTATPNAFRMFSFAQEFPYPGKRTLRTTVAAADADAERFNYEDRRRALVADLKSTYLDYVLTVKSLAILADGKALAEHLRQVSETRFAVGKGMQQDVVKAQLELSMILERQTVLEQQRNAFAARLNALLFRPAGTPPPEPVSYTVAPMPIDLSALQAQVDSQYPAIQRDAKLIDRSRRALELSRKELRPDFRVGVSAQRYVGDMPWMYGIEFMVSLPVYASRKQQPMITESVAALDAAEQVQASTRAMATSVVTQAFLAMNAADRLLALYSDSVLPQSRLALESSLAAYQAGSVDFLSVVTNYQALVAAQLSRAEQQTRRDQALVQLERYVGAEYIN
jgi:outer membrane protein TolC